MHTRVANSIICLRICTSWSGLSVLDVRFYNIKAFFQASNEGSGQSMRIKWAFAIRICVNKGSLLRGITFFFLNILEHAMTFGKCQGHDEGDSGSLVPDEKGPTVCVWASVKLRIISMILDRDYHWFFLIYYMSANVLEPTDSLFLIQWVNTGEFLPLKSIKPERVW